MDSGKEYLARVLCAAFEKQKNALNHVSRAPSVNRVSVDGYFDFEQIAVEIIHSGISVDEG